MLTNKPDVLTKEQHAEAERQGWSIFDCNGLAHVERIDELELISDEEAVRLARLMGVDCDDEGYVRSELLVTLD